MKKLISILLAIIIAMASVSAFAEEFSFHSGVKFGMTEEEVIACEKSEGNNPAKVSIREAECMDDDHHSGVSLDGIVAGKIGTTINYHFDSSEKMEAVNYWFIGEATDIKETLSEKYGEIDPELTWWLSFWTDAYSFASYARDLIKKGMLKSNYLKVLDEASWAVQYDENTHVVITYFSCIIGGSPFTYVSYQLYPSLEVEMWYEVIEVSKSIAEDGL